MAARCYVELPPPHSSLESYVHEVLEFMVRHEVLIELLLENMLHFYTGALHLLAVVAHLPGAFMFYS